MEGTAPEFVVEQLGRMAYADALEVQRARHAALVEGRAAGVPHQVLVVEHPAVITVTRRVGAAGHVLADEARLAAAGISLCQTDRGGDVTYHGPGQVVIYPIVDLQRLHLGIHAYIRALEEAAIRTCAAWGIGCHREGGATGVWVDSGAPSAGDLQEGAVASTSRKIAAIGVRVSRSATLHGMALNVHPELSHFDLIVPCGLHGRRVTSMREVLGAACPPSEDVASRLAAEVISAINGR